MTWVKAETGPAEACGEFPYKGAMRQFQKHWFERRNCALAAIAELICDEVPEGESPAGWCLLSVSYYEFGDPRAKAWIGKTGRLWYLEHFPAEGMLYVADNGVVLDPEWSSWPLHYDKLGERKYVRRRYSRPADFDRKYQKNILSKREKKKLSDMWARKPQRPSEYHLPPYSLGGSRLVEETFPHKYSSARSLLIFHVFSLRQYGKGPIRLYQSTIELPKPDYSRGGFPPARVAATEGLREFSSLLTARGYDEFEE